jgi:hypothetical protein
MEERAGRGGLLNIALPHRSVTVAYFFFHLVIFFSVKKNYLG